MNTLYIDIQSRNPGNSQVLHPVDVSGIKKAIPHTTVSAAADASTITSSDFLTLLVSELQNQDPTEPTDPNAYITQLVGVNSLQQLISINQGIATINSAGE